MIFEYFESKIRIELYMIPLKEVVFLLLNFDFEACSETIDTTTLYDL